MSAHTKEPWEAMFDESNPRGIQWGVVDSAIGLWVADCFDNACLDTESVGEANARRIAACVNACSGIETPTIEGVSFKKLWNDHKDLMAQRDEILADFKAARATLERVNDENGGPICDTIWHTYFETLFDFMDCAIHQAEQSL